MIGATATVLVAWGAAAWWLDARGRDPPSLDLYDAIVVAGCAVLPDGRPSPALARRVRRAVALFHEGRAARILLTGGVGPGTSLSEAEAAARMCREQGVPERALVLEPNSRTTQQNAAFAARLVSGRVLVVSDSYHAFRCRRMFARYFDHADAVGVVPPLRARVRLSLREVVAVISHGVAGRL